MDSWMERQHKMVRDGKAACVLERVKVQIRCIDRQLKRVRSVDRMIDEEFEFSGGTDTILLKELREQRRQALSLMMIDAEGLNDTLENS